MNATRTFAASTLRKIRREIAADSVLFGEQLLAETDLNETAGFSDLFMAARGDGADNPEHYHLGLEYIFEGFLLHYGRNRLLKPDENNFYLLAGDYMYARGLSAIAGLEDLVCVRELAELIRLCSSIHGENRDPALALSAWAVTTLRLAAQSCGCGITLPDSSGLSEIIWGGTPETRGFSKITLDDSGSNSNSTGETIKAGNDRDASKLEAVFEKCLAFFPEEKRAGLRQICSDINANFLTEA